MRRKSQVTRRKREEGFVLVTAAVAAIALVASLGLAVDIGRIYIGKNEAQSYADASAVGAALELDGTSAGIARAQAAVNNNPNHWDFDTRTFTGSQVQFATSAAGPWETNPVNPAGYTHTRVSATLAETLFFLPVAVKQQTSTVRASAVAAQVQKTIFREGLFPFSPYIHANTAPEFGLVRGRVYTLRWAANPKIHSNNVCPGDDKGDIIAIAQAQGGSERGFIEQTSSSVIRSTIIDDYQSVTRGVGDIIVMTGGAKQTQLDALRERINQDSDDDSTTFAQYLAAGTGNGRRVVAVPVNDGGSPTGSNNRIKMIGAFFLNRTGEYGNGGGQPWCAEYVGPWVQGSKHPGAGTAGAYVVRLVQ